MEKHPNFLPVWDCLDLSLQIAEVKGLLSIIAFLCLGSRKFILYVLCWLPDTGLLEARTPGSTWKTVQTNPLRGKVGDWIDPRGYVCWEQSHSLSPPQLPTPMPLFIVLKGNVPMPRSCQSSSNVMWDKTLQQAVHKVGIVCVVQTLPTRDPSGCWGLLLDHKVQCCW